MQISLYICIKNKGKKYWSSKLDNKQKKTDYENTIFRKRKN